MILFANFICSLLVKNELVLPYDEENLYSLLKSTVNNETVTSSRIQFKEDLLLDSSLYLESKVQSE
jgi:hypothetical protein